VAIFCQEYDPAQNFAMLAASPDPYGSVAVMAGALLDTLRSRNVIDEERVYLTGHSMGSMSATAIVHGMPGKFAAAASSSNASFSTTPSGLHVPVYLVGGEADMSAPLHPWSSGMSDYYSYHANCWDIEKGVYSLEPTQFYDFVDTIGQKTINDPINGSYTWTWSVNYGLKIPVVKFSKIANRAHNGLTNHMNMFWDFMKHFKVKQNANGTQTRYYSPSAFKTANDLVVLIPQPTALTVSVVKTIFKGGELPTGSTVDSNGTFKPVGNTVIEDKGTLLDQASLAGWSILDWYPKSGEGWRVELVDGKLVAYFDGLAGNTFSGEITVILTSETSEAVSLKIGFSGKKKNNFGCNAAGISFLSLALIGLVLRKK
jgi:hypothetical protein